MKDTNLFYYPFLLALLFYFIRTAMFWYSSLNYGVSTHDIWLYVSLLTTEVIIFLFILYYLINHRVLGSGVHIICLLWFLFALITAIYARNNTQSVLKMIIWPILFEATYLFIKDSPGRIVEMRYFYFLVMLIGFTAFASALLLKRFGTQTNMVYFMVLTVPFLLLIKSKKWRSIILAVATLAVLFSMKRSMMLAFALFWAIISALYLFRSGRIVEAIVVFILMVGIGYYSFDFVDSISGGFLSSRFEDEDMSNGRETIYEYTWQMIMNSDVEEWVLGHGHNAVFEDSPLTISAHNEFLEVIYDYGIIVLVLYLFFWLYVVRRWLFHMRCQTIYYIPYTLSICIFAVMAMVSQLILYASYFLYLVMFWAAVEAVTENDYKEYRRLRRARKAYSR